MGAVPPHGVSEGDQPDAGRVSIACPTREAAFQAPTAAWRLEGPPPGRPASLPWTRTAPCPRRKLACLSCSCTSRPLPSRGCRDVCAAGGRVKPPRGSTCSGPRCGGCYGLSVRPRARPPSGAAVGVLRRRTPPRRAHRWRRRPRPAAPSPSPRPPPPSAHGTPRRRVRPQDAAAQTGCYGGKQRTDTVKNVLRGHALRPILWLSDTYGGRGHERRLAAATPSPLPAGEGLVTGTELPWPAHSLRSRA